MLAIVILLILANTNTKRELLPVKPGSSHSI
jgi:hypothetical protein